MGLLSNEKQRNRLVKFLQNHHAKLSALMYIVGLAWFLALAYQPFNAGTYFSENALLPGLVESELPHVLTKAFNLKDEVKAEMNKDQKVAPQSWIFEKFRALGLDTYRHNFSVIYPFKSISKKVVQGENVFAILRARRAASTEALVLSVPLRPLANKAKPQTGGGIALALALASEFKQKAYWSKDVIFLFTDYDEVGTTAWLDAYHESKSEYIVSEHLEGRSGPIQAAINLELPLEKVSYYNLKLEGLNGQLPNLDLVNLVVKLCRKERGQVTLHHTMEPKLRSYYGEGNGESFQEYKTALTTMMRMMWYQASGAPSGNHGLFHRFHIEALTLEGVKDKKSTRIHDLTASARIIEGVFRSLNNLMERFHQSFFFYILPSTNRYVSIGMYMPPFGLMAAAGLITGIALWLISGDEAAANAVEKEKEADPAGTSLDGSEKSKTKADADKSEQDAEEEDDEMDPISTTGILTVIPVILVCLLLGWLAYQGPELLTRIMPKFRIHTEDMVLYSMLAIYTAALMYPKLMTRKSGNPNRLIVDWRLLKSIGLISQSLALASISLTNISQAFFLTAFMVPVTTFVRPSSYRFLRWVQMFALVLVSPLMLMFLVGFITVWPQPDVFSLFLEAFNSTKELIFLSVMDNYLFNAWTESVITAIVFPIWLFFWAIPWAEP
ncbi:glycosylphosphatidylinositol anchor attachment 1 protein [Aplysia californica]|uniref:Glycosylphosphatidylinositol anchor attachment 1 protein n=1 Tax=Aplysia californica TaxID=6500 RepID=A0ABM0K4M5_APLCA|nr:glycosylphosphatidylinositol anchor attachment 1 protein [Aplysia californica]